MTFAAVATWCEQHVVLLCFAVFVMIAVTTYWPGRRRAIEDHGLIPFREAPPSEES